MSDAAGDVNYGFVFVKDGAVGLRWRGVESIHTMRNSLRHELIDLEDMGMKGVRGPAFFGDDLKHRISEVGPRARELKIL